MTARKNRVWSLITVCMLFGLLLASGAVRPASAQFAQNQTPPVDEERGGGSRQTISPAVSAQKHDGLVSYREPSDKLLFSMARAELGDKAGLQQIQRRAEQLRKELMEGVYHGPDQAAYQRLLRNEQRALAANSSPAAMGLAVTGPLRLLTVAVEFNGTDTAENFVHPASVFGDRSCITSTITFEGPLHNELTAPGPRDNQSFWLPNFDKTHYERLLYSTEGITERVRPDLTDPEDGKPGIDISGSTMQNYYDEVSGGRVTLEPGPAGVIAWIQVPHSEGYYASNACFFDEDTGEFDPGRVQAMNGLPQNPSFPNGVDQLVKDIVDALNAADPNFPWQDYDTNGDGLVDHVVFFHAGADKSDGGGKEGIGAIWAHRGTVGANGYVADDGGTPGDPSDDIVLNGYTFQDEGAATGVIVHEFGHDLGYPDLYDTSGDDESDVVWWDLMSTGSHPGKLFQTNPTHLSAWSKFALGWADIKPITATGTPQAVVLGQTSNPPPGTEQGVRIDLPPNILEHTELLAGSTKAWWTGNDQDWADVRLTRDVDLTAQTAPISVSFDIDWAIEADWDFMFVEVSMDGGATYTQLKGYEVGTDVELTTPDSYPDPNGRLGDYGGLKYGYTGFTEDHATNLLGPTGTWARAYHDLSGYAGQSIKLRFRYATDAAFLERGAFIDNIAISAGATTILNDPVEGEDPNGWTPTVETFDVTSPLGQGWRLSTGTEEKALYYLLEWRNAEGFDKGLMYTYHTVFYNNETATSPPEWYVDKVPSNIPGMLVWLRDTRYGNEPFGADNTVLNFGSYRVADPSSEGPKGGLLVVDAHPEPLRGPFNSTIDFGFGEVPYPPLDNWSGRVQTTNAAFSLQPSQPFTLTIASGAEDPATTVLTPTLYGPQSAVTGYHDALGYYPGVEELPQPLTVFSSTTLLRIKKYALSDPDASVVVPATDYYPPRTPAGFTGKGGETSPPSANVSTFETMFFHEDSLTYDSTSIGDAGGTEVTGEHNGNPGSTGVQHGYHFEVMQQSPSGSTGTIWVYNAEADAQAEGEVGPINGRDPVTISASMKNTGSPRTAVLVSDFDERQATYVDGSATNGAIPVTSSIPVVASILETQGLAGLEAVRAQQADQVRAVVWYSPNVLDSGDTASFTYQVTPKAGVKALRVVTTVVGAGFSDEDVAQNGSFVYLPAISAKPAQ